MIEFSRKLNQQEQRIAQKTIQRNGFYAHPENVLRSRLSDENVSFRERAVEKILSIRKEEKEGKSTRLEEDNEE